MKTSPTLLALSLAANVALAATFFVRFSRERSGPTPPPSALAASAGSTLHSKSSPGPEPGAEDLALARALRTYADLMQAWKNPPGDGRWWRTAKPGAAMTREQRQRLWQAQRELAEALHAAFGSDLGLLGASDDPRFGFLPAGKRDVLRQIEQDYTEMMAEYSGANGIQLPSDREKLKLLRAEREHDIAALLTPEELLGYEMRTSPSAATLRARYGDAIESEQDFRALFSLQKAFDEKFPREALQGRIAPETLRARAEAERQLQADMQAALGNEKYAALRRASDNDLRTLDALTQRLNLPAGTTDNLIAARDGYAAEAQRINADASLAPQQRRSQIQELAARARAEVASTLGSEGAEAYAQRSPWLNFLQNGTAFTTTSSASTPALLGASNQSVYPVMPPGTPVPGGGTRQMFISNTGTTAGTPTAATENVQVFSFATMETSPAAPAPASPAPAPAAPPEVKR